MKRLNSLSSLFTTRAFSLRISLFALVLLITSTSYAAVLFRENFDAWPTGWTCSTASPNAFMQVWNCGDIAATCNGSSRPFQKGQGISANGRSGKAMQYPRSSCDANGYLGDLHMDLYGNFGGPYKELYFRWYVKFEEGFDKAISEGFKFMDRIIIRTPSGAEDDLYPSLHGSKLSSANLMLYGGWPSGYFATWRNIADNASFYPDHNWHSMELRIKLNSPGLADGAVQTWIDGVLAYSYENILIESSGDYYFKIFSFGLGNVSDSSWDQTTFKSMYYDDFVISTTYIGTETVSVTAPPVISGGTPSGTLASGTTSTSMSVATNESATCRYGAYDVAYASLPNTFTTTGGTSHSQTLSGLTNGAAYTYYVRCISASENANTSSTAISFSVASSVTVVNGACGTASGSSYTALTSSSANLCAKGTVASFSGTGPWTWGCDGSGGGTSTASNACTASLSTSTLLFSEDFENTSFTSRGWYDGGTCSITTSEYQSGTHSAQFVFTAGASTPSSPYAGAMRKLFTASDGVYLDYYIKYPTGWQEQSGNYGHHELYVASDADDTYTSLAFAHTMAYIEHWGTSGSSTALTPHMTIQDGANINQSQIGVDLTATTENRSANGCNGLLDSSFFSYLNCYDSGSGTYWNGKLKGAATASMSLNSWHHVQAYFKMNSVTANKGNADGTMAYWLDGVQQFRSDAVLFRTNQHATMKFNQFIIAPFMGNGAPRAQTFYIDNLKVWSGIPSSSAVGAVGGVTVKSVTNP